MKPTVDSSRRKFLSKAGVALGAPLAVAAASASTESIEDGAALKERLAMLEDMNAIRELQRNCTRHLNAGAYDELASLFVDSGRARLGEGCSLALEPLVRDEIEIVAGGNSATARVSCTMVTTVPIEPNWPLVEMARAQGGGVMTRCERGVLESGYVKRRGTWLIQRWAFVCG